MKCGMTPEVFFRLWKFSSSVRVLEADFSQVLSPNTKQNPCQLNKALLNRIQTFKTQYNFRSYNQAWTWTWPYHVKLAHMWKKTKKRGKSRRHGLESTRDIILTCFGFNNKLACRLWITMSSGSATYSLGFQMNPLTRKKKKEKKIIVIFSFK